MPKLTLSQLRTELARRLKQTISSTDTTTLDEAIQRAIRTIDSLASYTFLQKKATGTLTAGSTNINVPNDLNINKEIKLYLDGIELQYVPYSELPSYGLIFGIYPTAYAYVYDATTPKFEFNSASSTNLTYILTYCKKMTYPATGASETYAEIPEQWYDIILDVAEYQQKLLYNIITGDIARQEALERLKTFVREYNATQGAVININDEIIRKGG